MFYFEVFISYLVIYPSIYFTILYALTGILLLRSADREGYSYSDQPIDRVTLTPIS